ncbi:MAG TPA: DCC1-like thiol-disulfide oxidoreductase family protein [Panacibacter sp.]|nr:DCC1-like thiol-disulfide oxidoreductase family protein [Panacibacter sp.]
MEQLRNDKALIYDDNCPLCNAYTKAFVKGGFLKPENRIAFSDVNIQQFKIDWNRARHEIPLINMQTGEVKYGIDALIDILQQKFLFIKHVIKIKWLNWFLRKLYKLISYNRKIIVAARGQHVSSIDCTPDYSFFWRWALIILCYGLANFLLALSSVMIFKLYEITLWPVPGIIWIIIATLPGIAASKKTATDIHAHASVILFIASALLLMVSLFVEYFHISYLLFSVALVIIICLIIKQLTRRYYFMLYNNKR